MEVFFNNLKTSIGAMSPLLKVLVVGILTMIDVLLIIEIAKVHINPKKPVLRLGLFFVLAICIAVTVFVCVNVF